MSSDQNQSQSTSSQPQDESQSGRSSQDQQDNRNDRSHVPDDETILIETRPSWTVFVKSLTLAILILLAGLIGSSQTRSGSGYIIGLAAVVSLIIFIYVWYRRKRIRYVITDRRAMIVVGITSKSTTEIWLTKLTSMKTGASFFERILGHGTIHLSNDTLSGSVFNPFASNRMTLGGIKDPVRVANTIRQSKSNRE